MKCAEIRDKLADYSVELLDARTSRHVDAHLDICEDCRGELRALNAVVVLVETHGRREPPAGLFNGIRNQIEAGQLTQQRPAWWSFLFSAPARAGAMAMAIGALALGVLLPVQNNASLPDPIPVTVQPSAPTTTALASSIRQHALTAGQGPLTDRVAWEAVAQLVTPDNPNTPDVDESKQDPLEVP